MKLELKTEKELGYNNQSENVSYVVFKPETDMDLFHLGKMTNEFKTLDIEFTLNEDLQPNEVSIIDSVAVSEKEFILYLTKY